MKRAIFPVVASVVVLSASSARADDPVVISYTAPDACADASAFRALVTAQLARASNPDRPWRFEVTIRNEGDFVATLKTETGSRELRAPTCDDVTAALAIVIATSQPDLPSPSLPPPPPPPPSLSPPTPLSPSPDRSTSNASSPSVDWRVGARFQDWQDGSQLSATGGAITLSAEAPFGFPKMLFEIGAGLLFSRDTRPINYMATMPIATAPETWMMIDAQACPLDLPIAQTGISVLGCGHVAIGSIQNAGFAAYGGGGGRLRWQSPWHVYIETHFDGLYGTRITGIPALMDLGGSVGFRI